MNEKKFYSAARGSERSLIISGENKGKIFITIEADVPRGIQLKPATIPAVMLALAEAAAVPMQGEFSGRREGTPGHLSFIAQHLERYVVESEHMAAEAEAQAQLEAEALKLWLACRAVSNKYQTEDIKFSDLDAIEQAEWLAVARKAREMRAEK